MWFKSLLKSPELFHAAFTGERDVDIQVVACWWCFLLKLERICGDESSWCDCPQPFNYRSTGGPRNVQTSCPLSSTVVEM